MMGLGYLGSSSSSSSSASSNLSPLAPPFTVERSNRNKLPNTLHPSSFSSWPYSYPSTSTHEFLSDSVRTATLPSPNDYEYMSPQPHNWSAFNPNLKTGLEPVNSLGTRWSAVNPTPISAAESKPFYPPYVSDDIPLVPLKEPTYDLLSASGDKSFKADYTHSLSGLEYNPQQEGIWNGKHTQTHDDFFSEGANIAYDNYMNQGVYGAETLSEGKDNSSMFYYADTIKRENNIRSSIIGRSDVTSFSANNHRLVSNEFSEGPTYGTFPMFSESHPLVTLHEPFKEPWNTQKSYPLYEKKFHMFDCSSDRISSSVTKSTPLVIKPPALVSSFLAQSTVSSKNVEIGNTVAFNGNDVDGNHNPSREMELHLPQDLGAKGSFLASNQPRFQLGSTDEHTFVAPFSTKEEMPTKMSTNDQLNFEFKAKPSFQVPDINIPIISNTESVQPAANSFEHVDHHNPAEDSPCWKGTPTSYISPFGSPEAESSPQHPTKKLQMSNCANSQGSQTAHLFNHSPNISSSELLEINEPNERTTPHEKEHKCGDGMGVGLDSAKANSIGVAQSSHDTVDPTKVYGFLNESTSDENSQTYQQKLPNLREDDLSMMKILHPFGYMEHTIDVVQNVVVSSAADEKVSTDVLVKALHYLSDLLLRHCSNDGSALTEQNYDTLKHVIGNLDVCKSRKIQQVAPSQKLILPQQKSPNMFMEVKIETTDHQARHHQRNDDTFGKHVENLVECASPGDETALLKNHKMIQEIKKVLDENLECKEELPSQALLYKNLWLEAEAMLCGFNYKTRFERMKGEMEKWKLDKATVSDASEITAGKKIKSSSGSPDVKTPTQLIHEADGSKVPNTQVQNHPLSSANSHVDDVEASVMARFSILKHRGERPKGVNVEVQELADDQVPGDSVVNASGSDVGESDPVNDVEEQADAEVFGKENQSCDGMMGSHFLDEANKEAAAYGTYLMQNQFNSGWYNASYTSSDWEHILKDEFSWQTSSRIK